MGEPVVHLSYRERREFWEAQHPYKYSYLQDSMPLEYKTYREAMKRNRLIREAKARKKALEIVE